MLPETPGLKARRVHQVQPDRRERLVRLAKQAQQVHKAPLARKASPDPKVLRETRVQRARLGRRVPKA